jgi:hypothetical protein
MIQAGRRYFANHHAASQTLVLPPNCHRTANSHAGCTIRDAVVRALV